MVRLLARVVGIGIEPADMLVNEVLSRPMRDRRAVGWVDSLVSVRSAITVEASGQRGAPERCRHESRRLGRGQAGVQIE
jgi:hypothetical protein